MEIRLKKGTQYALRGLLWMAGEAKEEPVGVMDLAKELRISESYLAKLFYHLARVGILVSLRGRQGGFLLKKEAEKIRLVDVISACEHFEPGVTCMLDGKRCRGDKRPCQVHPVWEQIQSSVRGLLDRTTLADLVGNHPVEQHRVGVGSASERKSPWGLISELDK